MPPPPPRISPDQAAFRSIRRVIDNTKVVLIGTNAPERDLWQS